MAIVAKMRATESHMTAHVSGSGGPEQERVRLEAVYSDDPTHPNHEWSKYTPSGELELYITNPDAMGKLTVGSEYYVEIRKARS